MLRSDSVELVSELGMLLLLRQVTFCAGIVRNGFNWTGSINKAIQNKKEEENTAQVF